MTKQSWQIRVRLDDVPATGMHLDLVADERERAAVRELAEVRDLPRLEAAIDVVRHRNGLRATGRISATVVQTCIITVEPLESTVEEAFDVIFAPAAAPAPATGPADEVDEPPEALVDGMADLGAVATEFLLLGIEPYPRKPGAVFAAPVDDRPRDGPFAALAKLKHKGGNEP
jgi:uncharacterized metal-binding protein YceD (DUF177 family)